MITHDLDSLYAITDRVAVIADKKVVGHRPRCASCEQSDHPWINEYFPGTARPRRGRRPKTARGAH